ncbi:chemotaxis protein CheA [Litorivicinus lipolyticus]|uniref:Chemotaxis protein CheA n=1 Tax=Litorivicinus lipolyticus TaxID=418701 RepID=A0A5Q2QD39_9GAMM|nr:chemotaxis protein CheA [Litorivicinus lipolyticus]QGG80261.1 chemotaxis protein CheA [Litorivicinus lipolyticus]
MDEEILQDFLVEAGELLEALSEQLVELEQRPEDYDLLNAIFRGFHTIKGGAGFLAIDAMVECCHITENLFDSLRSGKLSVNAELMDAVLNALDEVQRMFGEVNDGQPASKADPALIARLHALEAGETAPTTAVSEPQSLDESTEAAELPIADAAGSDASEAEFEAMLNAIAPVVDHSDSELAGDAPATDLITDDEFEALLDELHGEGQMGGPALAEASAELETPKTETTGDDEITEDEFEALLDQLHGEGQHASSTPAETAPAAAAAPTNNVAPMPVRPKAVTPAKPKEETSVRVDTARLDDIMNMVGELVLVRNRLVRLSDKTETSEDMGKAVANLDVVTADLQSAVMKTRMQPIKKVFGRFPRVVRDLARSLEKEVNLELVGEETDLDKNLVEALSDPLVHLVRNSVDHGIETPAVREASGKPRKGTVVLSAKQEGDHILLSITDDGAGMDAEVLRNKAVEKGMMDSEAASRLSDSDAYNLIFDAGFSTKEAISDVSGRGVGMDVVKTKISQLNGALAVLSEKGRGTRIEIKVPLTLAIMPTLMVLLQQQAFALPLASVNEIFHLDLTETNVVDGQEVIIVRGRPLPLFYLKRWLVKGANPFEKVTSGHVVIVTVSNMRVALVVDHLIGQEEVVIKPLGKMLQGTAGMAGATITGDGRMALILDIGSLLKRYAA